MEIAAEAQLFEAMAKAFAEMEGASKDSVNPHFKSKYADLSSVVGAIKPALTKHGLWFAQLTHEQDGGVCIETLVCHAAGARMSFGKLFVPASKNDAQGYGSALSYARRYSLMTAFGVCPEDDDGNAAVRAPAAKAEENPVSEAQLLSLRDLLKKADAEEGAFCDYLKVKSLEVLPSSRFEQAKKALENRAKSMEAN